MRITSAADDAAGLSAATNLATQAQSGRQAIRNANDGTSVIQTAESASKEVLNILDRMRELAVQSLETLEDGERAYIDSNSSNSMRSSVSRKARSSTESPVSRRCDIAAPGSGRRGCVIELSSPSNCDLTASTSVDMGSVDLSAATGAGCHHDNRQCNRYGQQRSCIVRQLRNRLEFDQQHGELCGGTVF